MNFAGQHTSEKRSIVTARHSHQPVRTAPFPKIDLAGLTRRGSLFYVQELVSNRRTRTPRHLDILSQICRSRSCGSVHHAKRWVDLALYLNRDRPSLGSRLSNATGERIYGGLGKEKTTAAELNVTLPHQACKRDLNRTGAVTLLSEDLLRSQKARAQIL